MESSLIPALLMSAIAFLIPIAQMALLSALLKSATKTYSIKSYWEACEKCNQQQES